MTTPSDPQEPQDPAQQPPAPPPPPPGYGAPPPGYGPPPPGYGYGQPQSQNQALPIVGIVLGVCCWPIGLVLGIVGFNQAKSRNQPTNLATAAIIVASIVGVLSILAFATGHSTFHVNSNP